MRFNRLKQCLTAVRLTRLGIVFAAAGMVSGDKSLSYTGKISRGDNILIDRENCRAYLYRRDKKALVRNIEFDFNTKTAFVKYRTRFWPVSNPKVHLDKGHIVQFKALGMLDNTVASRIKTHMKPHCQK